MKSLFLADFPCLFSSLEVGPAPLSEAAMSLPVSSLSDAIGSKIRITQVGVAGMDAQVEADLFAVDAQRGLAVLRRGFPNTWQKASYFFVPIASITSLEVRRHGFSRR